MMGNNLCSYWEAFADGALVGVFTFAFAFIGVYWAAYYLAPTDTRRQHCVKRGE